MRRDSNGLSPAVHLQPVVDCQEPKLKAQPEREEFNVGNSLVSRVVVFIRLIYKINRFPMMCRGRQFRLVAQCFKSRNKNLSFTFQY